MRYGEESVLGPFKGRSVTFSIPWTKTTRQAGAVLTVVGDDSLSPYHAMKHHLSSTKNAPPDSHLFSYRDSKGVWHPMVKRTFLDRCNGIWRDAGLEALEGHGFRIGGASELLCGGVPPHVVAMTGRWKSLVFLKYWRNVAEIISSSFASCYDRSRIDAVTKSVEDFCNITA